MYPFKDLAQINGEALEWRDLFTLLIRASVNKRKCLHKEANLDILQSIKDLNLPKQQSDQVTLFTSISHSHLM